MDIFHLFLFPLHFLSFVLFILLSYSHSSYAFWCSFVSTFFFPRMPCFPKRIYRVFRFRDSSYFHFFFSIHNFFFFRETQKDLNGEVGQNFLAQLRNFFATKLLITLHFPFLQHPSSHSSPVKHEHLAFLWQTNDRCSAWC